MDVCTDLNQRFLAKIQEYQSGSAGKYVVFLPVACGLGGQITGRVQTLAMALALGRTAIFLHLEDRPYGQTFEAMHPRVDLLGSSDTWPLADITCDQEDIVVCYDPSRQSVSGPEFESALLERVSQQIGMHITDRLMLEGMIFNWMKPTPSMAAYCRLRAEQLEVDSDCLGVHFRRGDKAVETAFVPASEFNRQIAQIHSRWPFNKLFLASDSPLAPDEIKCPPGVRLLFDKEEQRYNNANHKMLLKSPELVDQETRVAFKNIALLAMCGGVVGQDNAHFATLSASSIMARENRVDRLCLIPGRFVEQNSWILARYFLLKNQMRAVARRLFPHLTMSARMKRSK